MFHIVVHSASMSFYSFDQFFILFSVQLVSGHLVIVTFLLPLRTA